MTESLGKRVGRIVSGSVNALIDAAENLSPEMVMDEAIREIDRAIDSVRHELGETEAQIHLVNTTMTIESTKHEDLSEKVKLALREGKEDLAEVAVEAILNIEAQMPVLQRTLSQANERKVELEGFIAALKGKKREMEGELTAFRQSRKRQEETSGAGFGFGPGTSAASGGNVDRAVERAESAFDRILARNTGLPSKDRQDLETGAKLADLEEMKRKSDIRDRLSTFKTEISGEK